MEQKLHLLGGYLHAPPVHHQLIGVQVDHQLVKGELSFLWLDVLTVGTAHDGVDAGDARQREKVIKDPCIHIRALLEEEIICIRR